jgi:signal peptidase II
MKLSEIRKRSRIVWLIFFGVVLLLLDFLSKAYVYHILPYHHSCTHRNYLDIPVFFDFVGIDFFISLALNKGAAWGLLADFQIPLLIVRIAVIFGLIFYLFFINRKIPLDIPLMLIIAGATGNVVDFFLYGYVIDFLHFNLWGYHFPIFNFADSCITIGVGWLFLYALLARKKNRWASAE